MQITIRREELARAIGAVSRVVENRNIMPILSSLKLEAAGDNLSITATDLAIVASVNAVATVAAAGVVCVEAKLIGEIAKKASGDITMLLDGDMLIVKSGRSRFSLKTLDVRDFPSLDVGTYEASFDIDLAALFAPVAFAISNEETRHYLNGIYFIGGDKFTAVATDGHRLGRHVAAGGVPFPGIIVPRKTVGIIPKGVVAVSVSSSKIRIVGGDLTIVSKLIDGTFPDYQRVIPANNEMAVVVDRDEMMKAAERVVTVSSEKSKAVKLSVAPGGVLLSARSETGTAEDEVATDYTGKPLEIGFNSAYLRDVFAVLQPGKVTMRLQDGGPALIEGGEEGLDLVIMPMRV